LLRSSDIGECYGKHQARNRKREFFHLSLPVILPEAQSGTETKEEEQITWTPLGPFVSDARTISPA
jgi:hypothetical protein